MFSKFFQKIKHLVCCKNNDIIPSIAGVVLCVLLIIAGYIIGYGKAKISIRPKEVIVHDTLVVIKPADTVVKFVEKIKYIYQKPETTYVSIGKVDSFLLEHPRGITKVFLRKNRLEVEAYFSDTAYRKVYNLRHSNFDAMLSYNNVIVRQPRFKFNSFIGVKGVYNFNAEPDFGILGGVIMNDRWGIFGEVNTQGVGVGILRKF